MTIITLDFETYYDDEYSLRKLTYEQYVRDPRFEAIMCSIHIPSERELYWVKGDEIGKELQRLELDKHVQIAHNNAFDAFRSLRDFSIRLWLYPTDGKGGGER